MEMMENNLSGYNARAVVDWYVASTEIMPAEEKVFKEYERVISEAILLDIGIGGGRTTKYLINSCKNYTGIDYVEDFVKHAKQKFPAAEIRLMDARDLSFFKDNTFDFVNFSFNGMDYVDLDGRTKVLKEVNRVLRPNGMFFFSTHNKAHETFNKSPWLSSENSLFTNAKTFFKLALFLPNHYKKKRGEVIKDEYAIINDSAHNFSLMTFYTSPAFLREQLMASKFSDIKFLLRNGHIANSDLLDNWIFVVCKKSAL